MITAYDCNKWYRFKDEDIANWLNNASSKDIEFYNMLGLSPFMVTELTNDGCVERVQTMSGTSIDAEDFDQWCILNDSDRYVLEEVESQNLTNKMSLKSKIELVEKLIAEIKAEL